MSEAERWMAIAVVDLASDAETNRLDVIACATWIAITRASAAR
jgi:hypothetical protein